MVNESVQARFDHNLADQLLKTNGGKAAEPPTNIFETWLIYEIWF